MIGRIGSEILGSPEVGAVLNGQPEAKVSSYFPSSLVHVTLSGPLVEELVFFLRC